MTKLLNKHIAWHRPFDATDAPAPFSAWAALAILVLVTIFSFVDRQVLTILADPMRHSLSMSDIQIGMLQGVGLTLFAVVGAVPLAMLADRFDKRTVLAGCIAAWALATAACGLAQSFGQLLLATVGIAVGEAGIAPVVYSMIPSLFHGRQRGAANLVYYSATILGASLGMALGGAVYQVLPADGTGLPAFLHGFEIWRLALFAAALPAPAFVILVLLIRSPRDTLHRARPADGSNAGGEFRGYIKSHSRTLVGLFASVGFTCAAFAPVMAWLPTAIARTYGVSPGDAGMRLGSILSAGALGGIAISALATRLWRQRYGELLALKTGRILAVAAALAAGLPLVVKSLPMTYLMVLVMSVASIGYCALLPGLYQAIAPESLRARTVASASIVTAVCTALGPVVVGSLSDFLSSWPDGLLLSIAMVSAPCMLVSAGLMALTVKPARATLMEVNDLPS
jgi:MFS family permease